MRAVALARYGGPEVLEIVALSAPEAGPGEVRIRVLAAAVNPADTILRAGDMAAGLAWPPPYIPGMDAAGTIDAIGPNTSTTLRPGDPVVTLTSPARQSGGTYAEFIVVPVASVARAPAGVDLFAASTLLMNATSAWMALDAAGVTAGSHVLVSGAAGVFGGFAVQLAAHRGLIVLADASASDVEFVRAAGAHHLLPRGPDLARSVRGICPGGVDAVLDGALLQRDVLPAVRDGGTFVSMRHPIGEADRSITTRTVRVSERACDTALLAHLVSLVEVGVLTLRVAGVLPAEQAAEAHRRLAAGGTRGRLVLDFS